MGGLAKLVKDIKCSVENLEKKETNYNADLTQQPQKNTELLIQKISKIRYF